MSQTTVLDLLHRIKALQGSEAHLFAPAGLFPSYRKNDNLGYRRADNSIYFTASIAMTLLMVADRLSPEELKVIRAIVSTVERALPDYQNKERPYLYNFYPKKPKHHFRDGRLLHRLTYFALADDADDTSVIHLLKLLKNNSAENRLQGKNAIDYYRMRTLSKVDQRNHLPIDYRGFSAHGTWCGTERMTLVYDVCVICNVLALAAKTNTEHTDIENDSYSFINYCLTSRDLIDKPYKTSNYYADPFINLYHVARLYAVSPDGLDYSQLVKLHGELLIRPMNLIQKIMMSSAAAMLGLGPQKVDFTNDQVITAAHHHSSFIAPMLGSTTLGLLNKLAPAKISWLTYHCEAYCLALAAESLLLSGQ